MQDDLDIKISMLLDGELESQEALKILTKMKSEPELRAKWARYNAVSSAFKAKPVVVPDTGFFDRVADALDKEPIVLSPGNIPEKRRLRPPSIAAALAASVAILGVVFWTTVHSPINDYPNEPRLLTSTQNETPVATVPVKAHTTPKRIFPRRFNDYLITHNGSSYTAGAQRIIPYAQTVSYSSDH